MNNAQNNPDNLPWAAVSANPAPKADKELDKILADSRIVRIRPEVSYDGELWLWNQKAKTALLAWRDKAVVAARIDEIERIALATNNGDMRDGVRAATYLTERGDYLNQLAPKSNVGDK